MVCFKLPLLNFMADGENETAETLSAHLQLAILLLLLFAFRVPGQIKFHGAIENMKAIQHNEMK